MFTNPYFRWELARDRSREMLAQAGQQRQAHELARASRSAEGPSAAHAGPCALPCGCAQKSMHDITIGQRRPG